MSAALIACLSGAFIGYLAGLYTAWRLTPAIMSPLVAEAWGDGAVWGAETAKAVVHGSTAESVADGFAAWAKRRGVTVRWER